MARFYFALHPSTYNKKPIFLYIFVLPCHLEVEWFLLMVHANSRVSVYLGPQIDERAVIQTDPSGGAGLERHCLCNGGQEAGKLDCPALGDNNVLSKSSQHL